MNKMLLEQILKEELLIVKLNEDVLKEHKQLVSERNDAQSLILREILYSKYGRDFDIYQIDESLWGKVKNMVAKGGKALANAFNIGKRGYEKELDRQELEDLTTKAGKALPGGLIKQLTQPDPNGEKFPNQEDKQNFASRLDAIAFAYGAVLAALKAGTIPHESAEAAITALKKFLENSLGNMSTVYKTFNEEEEGDDEVINEEVLNEINARRVFRKAMADGGEASVKDAIDKLGDFILKKGSGGGGRVEAAKSYIQTLLDQLPNPTAAAQSIPQAVQQAVASAPTATATTGAATVGATKVGTVTTTAKPAALIVNTMKTTPSLKGLLAALGVTPAAAAALAGAALVGGLYLKGKISSRAASIKRLLKTMAVPEATAQTNVVPEPGEPEPAPTGPGGDEGAGGAAGGDAAAGAGDEPVSDALPISASEIAILQGILRGGVTRIISKSLADLGAAATQEKDAAMLKALKRNILPKVNALYKRANIDLAESFENLDEKELPRNVMSKQDQRAKKGQMRGKLGLKSALVKVGEKEPRLKRLIKKNFEQSFKNIKNVAVVKGAVNKEMKRRLKAAGGNEKKVKEIQKTFQRQLKDLNNNPERRLKQLQQSADVFINAVMDIVDDGIKATLKQFEKEKAALPEHLNETLERWQVIAGINKKVL